MALFGMLTIPSHGWFMALFEPHYSDLARTRTPFLGSNAPTQVIDHVLDSGMPLARSQNCGGKVPLAEMESGPIRTQ